MSRIRTVAVTAATLVSTIFAASAATSATAQTAIGPPKSPYATAGRWITDSQGRVYISSGVNMVYKKGTYQASDTGFSDDDGAFLKSIGIDSVRLGLAWKAVEPKPGVYDDKYIDGLIATTRMLDRYGISTLVDSHQDMQNERFQGQGAPDWAVKDKGWPSFPQLGFPANSLLNLGLLVSWDAFLDNEAGPGGVGLQDRYAAMWGHVAKRFKGVPGVLGWDIINEPLAGSKWGECLDGQNRCPGVVAKIGRLHEKAGQAIRAQNPDGVVMYEPIALITLGAPALTAPPKVKNQALSYHSYCPFITLFNFQPFCEGFDDEIHADSLRVAARDGSAALMTEWGATNNLEILTSTVDRAARFMVGQQWWAYCSCGDPTTIDQTGQGIVEDPSKPPVGANLRQPKIDILATPRPRAIAGTPVRYGYNRSTKAFTLEYTTARAAGGGAFATGSQTIVSVPKLIYPAGYTVSATGATVGSAANAADLVLRQSVGATSVKVTVSAR
ncbi:MAG: cellulase family glycosylhydrolase [Baekduia sp.]